MKVVGTSYVYINALVLIRLNNLTGLESVQSFMSSFAAVSSVLWPYHLHNVHFGEKGCLR